MHNRLETMVAALVLAIMCRAGPADNPRSRPATSQAARPATSQAASRPTSPATQPATSQAASRPTSPATQPATTQATQPATTQATQPATTQAVSRPTLDEALKKIVSYRRGEDRTALEVVAEHVRPTIDSKHREALEQRFVSILQSKATYDCKRFVCLQLEIIGSAESVPVLAKLLKNKHLSYSARKVLTHMPNAEAAAALREALGKLKGAYLIGVIDSVASRRDEQAAEALQAIICRGNQSAAAAAIAALGTIGGTAGDNALAQATSKAPRMLRPAIAVARLRCARGLIDVGKADQAIAIYDELALSTEIRIIRMAALRSLVAHQPEKAAHALAQLITCQDLAIRMTACEYVVQLPSRKLTIALGQQLPELSVVGQLALLGGLVARRDVVARPAVIEATSSKSIPIRIAAIRALGSLGNATTVPLLAELAAKDDPTYRDAARDALRRLPGKTVDQAILWAIKGAEVGVRCELIRSLASRRATWAVPELIDSTSDGDQGVRIQAFEALGTLAEGKFLGKLVDLLLKVKSQQVRAVAEYAVASCGRRADRADGQIGPVLAAMAQAKVPARCSLLRVLAKIRGPKALAAIRKDRKHPSDKVREAVIRILAESEDPSVAGDLLEIIAESSEEQHHVMALWGYLRLAGGEAKKSPSDSVAMYSKALRAARRLEDKKSILSALSQVHHWAALKTVMGSLDEDQTREEAAASAVRICDAIAYMHRDKVTAALGKVLEADTNKETKTHAKRILDRLKRCMDHILAWEVTGPYAEDGKGPKELFAVAFDPESSGRVQWKPIYAGTDHRRPWAVVLSKVFAGRNRVAYVRTQIWSPQDHDARLEMGSDDGLKVWFNDSQVYEANQLRFISRGQDKVKVKLKKGSNTLMIKVTQGDGDWFVCARIRSATGGKLEGIRTKAN